MRAFLIIIFFCISTQLYSQEILIPGTNLKVEMPNDKWSLTNTQDNNTMTIYYYKREPIEDSLGRQVIPNISIIKESNSGMDVVTYSAMKRSQMPAIDIEKIFIPKDIKMKYKNGIGYLGYYSDKYGKHKVYIMFLNDGDVGLRIICDVMYELFEQVDKEFVDMFKSISQN